MCGKRDAGEHHVVGDVEWEAGQDRSPIRFGRCAEPASCCFSVSFGHREEREQPACVAPHCGCALFEHDVRDVAEAAGLTGVAGVDRESPERDDAGSVEHRRRTRSVLEGEAAFEQGCRLGDSSGSQEHASVPGFEHLVCPSLMVALGGSEAVGGYCHRLVVSVGDAQELAVPHVREPQALVVAREDAVAIGLGDQLVSRSEVVVGVFERALGDTESERRSSVSGGLDRGTGFLEHLAGLLEATCGDEIVEEAGEMAGAQGLRGGQGGSGRGGRH